MSEEKIKQGSPEWQLLMLTASLELDEYSRIRFDSALVDVTDWDLIVNEAARHGTVGVLYRHIMGPPENVQVPGEVLERLKNIHLAIAVSNMQHLARAKMVLGELQRQGVEVILVKGAALLETLYGDLGMRAMSDIDILVREEDWPIASRTLKAGGYRAVGRDFEEAPPKLSRYDIASHVQYVSESGTCLEFQFDLFTLGIGMKDMDGVWARSRRREDDGLVIRELSPEDELLHLAIHANRHGCMRLKWLMDISEIMRQKKELDWERFLEIARREMIGAAVYQTLGYMEELLQVELMPRAIRKQLKPRIWKRVVWRTVWPRRELMEFRGRNEDAVTFYFYRPFSGWNLLNFILMGRPLDKIVYQFRWIFPPVTWIMNTYGQPRTLSLVKYYALRMLNYRKEKHKI